MGCLYKRKQNVCTVCGRLADADCRTTGHRIEVRELPTIWIKYYQNGRAIRESTGTTKETKARRMLRDREGDVEKGIPINPRVGRVTFEEAAEDFLNDYLINKRRTHKNAKHRINTHLARHFGRKRLISITTSDVRAFVAARLQDTIIVRKARIRRRRDGTMQEIPELRRPVSAAEINRELATLKRMFSLAKKAGKLYHAPHIEKLREDNVRRGFFEREQFEAVRTHLPAPLQPVVTFAYMTGWRLQSEILSLEWRQVDWEGRTIRLDPGTTKNREGRTFPFTLALEQLLKEQLVEHERLKKADQIVPYVFHRIARNNKGELVPGMRIRTFRRAWRSACRAAGVPGRIFHDFRRTAVRNLERAGVPRSAAMLMVGHKTEAIYRRYSIVDAGVLRDAAAKLDQAIGPLSTGSSTSANVTGTLSGTLTADRPVFPAGQTA
jgi:integrase